MNNNEIQNFGAWNDDCTSRGACSLPPSVSSLQELLLYLIRQTAYYIAGLDKLNLNNPKIIKEIIKTFSSLVFVNELGEKHLYSLILQNYYAFKNCRQTYIDACKTRNIAENLRTFNVKFDENTSVSSAISEGDKILKKEYKSMVSDIRNYMQIFYIVLKSVCLNINRLYDFDDCTDSYSIEVIKSLNVLNNSTLYELLSQIKNLAQKDFLLNLRISKELRLNFGQILKVNVSHSTRSGKAILVSGTNFFDLLNVLELTKDKNIDIYTHSGLLLAHALEKFRQYKNLIGHYGNSTENCIIDFGTFPGAILLTNNSKNNTEFLYRGKIFSNDYLIPQGVTKIKNNDYTSLIDSALNSKGFSKGKIKPDSVIGYNEASCLKLMDKIFEKLVNSEIKHLYIIIGNSHSDQQKEYFKIFLENIKPDEFVLSFSYGKTTDNVFVIDLGYYYPVITEFIYKIIKHRELHSRIVFLFDACTVCLISGVIYLKGLGVKNIYVSHCSPRLINPSVFDTLVKKYDLNYTANPLNDLNNIRKNYT